MSTTAYKSTALRHKGSKRGPETHGEPTRDRSGVPLPDHPFRITLSDHPVTRRLRVRRCRCAHSLSGG